MIWHVVLMKPRADLRPADRRALLDAFKRAIKDIPTIREVRVGRRVNRGTTYDHAGPDSPDVLVSIGFDHLAGLQAYLGHPAHEELASRFARSLQSGWVFDFESGEIDEIS